MSRRAKRRTRGGIVSKLWLPAVVLVVIAVVGYGVNSVRNLSDLITNPPAADPIPATVVQINPKNITYEVFGTSVAEAQSPTPISTASRSRSN